MTQFHTGTCHNELQPMLIMKLTHKTETRGFTIIEFVAVLAILLAFALVVIKLGAWIFG